MTEQRKEDIEEKKRKCDKRSSGLRVRSPRILVSALSLTARPVASHSTSLALSLLTDK